MSHRHFCLQLSSCFITYDISYSSLFPSISPIAVKTANGKTAHATGLSSTLPTSIQSLTFVAS